DPSKPWQRLRPRLSPYAVSACGHNSSCKCDRRKESSRVGLLRPNRINVLIHGVSRPHVPILADTLHGWQNLDELAHLPRHYVPAFADVAVQRKRLVLGKNVDAAQVGVNAIGERDVDDAVDATEGDSRLGPVPGQRI